MTSYLQEQNRFVIKQDPLSSSSTTKVPSTIYKQYVCKPNYRNVTTVHDVLRRIIEDIDNNQQLHPTKRILDRLEKSRNSNIEVSRIFDYLFLEI
jgi:hypothetical protein